MAYFGTHDSVTGEKGHGIINLFRYLGQTQSYTIIEQAKAGIKYFDLRVRRTSRGWICAHGLWETEKTFYEILKEISSNTIHDQVYIAVTYEGTLPNNLTEDAFVKFIKKTIKKFNNLIIYSISEKYKKISWKKKVWNTIWVKGNLNIISHYTHFSLTPFPPIPSLWKKDNNIEFPDDPKTIVILDFFKE